MIVNNKIGITLSGGGFKGIAHLGVLQFLQEMDVPIHAVSGASAGALVGAFIAQGYSPQEVLQFAKEENFFSYSSISVLHGGLFSANIFETILQKYIPHNSFEGLKLPLYVSVTDLTNAQSLIFNQGSLSFAIKASCCFPMVFTPVVYQGDIYLCDGGLTNNFPVEQIRATCSKSIGVNVEPLYKVEGKFGFREIISRIIRITTSSIRKDVASFCDIYMQLDEISRYNTFDTKKIDEMYQIGYTHAKKYKKELLDMKDDMISPLKI